MSLKHLPILAKAIIDKIGMYSFLTFPSDVCVIDCRLKILHTYPYIYIYIYICIYIYISSSSIEYVCVAIVEEHSLLILSVLCFALI